MEISKRDLILLVFAGCFVVTGIFVNMGIGQYRAFQKIKADEKMQTRRLADLEAEIKRVEAFIKKYDEEILAFEKYLFSEQDIPAFLESISRFAQQETVDILDMKTEKFEKVEQIEIVSSTESRLAKDIRDRRQVKTEEADGENQMTLAAMPVKVKVEGQFENFLKFLKHLEQFDQLSTVSNIEINQNSQKYPVLDYSFTIKIYSMKNVRDVARR